MKIRKIAVVGGFAVGAALAFAPLASADDLTTTVDSEISLLNSIFTTEATLAGDSSDISGGTTAGSFETILLTDAPQTAPFTTLDYELYGINPAFSGPASDPGSYNVFNGALTEFSDAFNSEEYGLLNTNALIPDTDLFGSSGVIDAALATGTDTGAATTFFDAGLADLAGFFDIPSL
ncbi:MAG: hypothetical protein WB967_19090 [Mycobacterium sp.]|uniref:hypothetical protein n=2 Tax=Mycobacterium sp. TaxID=1785 RepID=UPI003BB6EF75